MPQHSQVEPHSTPANCAACRTSIRQGSQSFYIASLLLPVEIREPAYAVYAFCRMADDLIDRHQVVLIDPPGQGRSQALEDFFSFDDCARCVADILDGLGLDKAHFVGNSWGGMIGATITPPLAVGSTLASTLANFRRP